MDVDIDLPTSFDAATIFPWTKASLVKNEELSPHPCGVYPQKIPVDDFTGLAAIPYKEAEELGYTKIDMLHLSLYNHFESREEIEALVDEEPDWTLLLDPVQQKKLFQLSNHGDILDLIKPRCVEELADCLALIRPGKKQLAKLYKTHRDATRKSLYAPDETGYAFKKSHAIAYSLVLVLQLHLISAKII